MATELQKPHNKEETVETWKLLYSAARDQAFNELMYLMAEHYSLELLIEVPDRLHPDETLKLPSPTVKYWRESLHDLSPQEMLEGFRNYQCSERRSFKPTPQDIRENAADVKATDKPRKVYDPHCPDCKGSGQRMVMVKSIIYKNRMVQRSADCFCKRMVYGGVAYAPTQPQLPPGPRTAQDENSEAAEALAVLEKKLPAIRNAAHEMPQAPKVELTEEETSRQRDRLKRQFEEHQRKQEAK